MDRPGTAPGAAPPAGGAHDAVIVGAGLAGAAAATLLARGGWRVALVERKRFPRRKVCGECLAASNLPLLDALGVGAAFEASAGAELRRVALLAGGTPVEAPLPPAPRAERRWGRALGRDALDALLVDAARAAGADVLQPCALREVAGGPGRWRCSVRGTEGGGIGDAVLEAPVLIDAHGSWETLPFERGIGARGRRDSDLLAFKAVFEGAGHAPDTISVLALDGGYGGIVTADGGRTTVAGCVRRDRLGALRARAPGARAGEVFERWLRGRPDIGGVLANARRDGPWLASGPLAPGIRTGVADGVLRIGNAGAEAHPLLGEGMSMALQSAALLAARLLDPVRGVDPRRAVDRGAGGVAGDDRAADAFAVRLLALQRAHHRDFRREFAPRLRLAAAFAHAAMRPGPARALAALARRHPALLTHGARRGGKVRLAIEPSTRARAGARA